jgi:hypothetical protein
MIPNGSTPIKNEILIEILAKGLLSKDEIRIVAYIIRWSWGFIGKNKRQNWTRSLKQTKIAEDIEMDRGLLNRNLKKMIAENKISEKDGCYQFNEHYDNWVKVDKKSTNKADKKLTKSQSKLTKSQSKLTKSQQKVDKKSISTGVKASDDNGLREFKENKETYKETLKEKGDVFIKTLNNFKTMRNKIKKPMTDKAESMLITRLEKLSPDVDTQIKIMEQSIFHCWQNVYPLKEEKIINPNQNGYEQFMEKVMNDRR